MVWDATLQVSDEDRAGDRGVGTGYASPADYGLGGVIVGALQRSVPHHGVGLHVHYHDADLRVTGHARQSSVGPGGAGVPFIAYRRSAVRDPKRGSHIAHEQIYDGPGVFKRLSSLIDDLYCLDVAVGVRRDAASKVGVHLLRRAVHRGYEDEDAGEHDDGYAQYQDVGDDLRNRVTALPGFAPLDELRSQGPMPGASTITATIKIIHHDPTAPRDAVRVWRYEIINFY